MYDTITLTKFGKNNFDFKLKSNNDWQITSKAGEILKQTLIIPLNEVKVGEKVYKNGSIGLSFSELKSSFSLTTSLPKLAYGSSCLEIKPSDKENISELLHKHTSDFLDIDFNEMNVYRLDSSVNLEMEKEPYHYIKAISSRLPLRVGTKHKNEYAGETIRIHDKTETVMLYDKVNQALDMNKNDKDFIASDYKDKNILRNENQYKTPKGMIASKRFGMKPKYKDIWKESFISRSRELRILNFHNMTNQKSKYKLDYETLIGDLITMKQLNKNAINDFGWIILLKSGVMTISDVIGLMKGAGYTRQYMSKVSKRLSSLDSIKSEPYQLINEVMEKLKAKEY